MSDFIVSLFILLVMLAIIGAYRTAPDVSALPRHIGAWLAVLIFGAATLLIAYRTAVLGWALV